MVCRLSFSLVFSLSLTFHLFNVHVTHLVVFRYQLLYSQSEKEGEEGPPQPSTLCRRCAFGDEALLCCCCIVTMSLRQVHDSVELRDCRQ